jgi:hypothetical protein
MIVDAFETEDEWHAGEGLFRDAIWEHFMIWMMPTTSMAVVVVVMPTRIMLQITTTQRERAPPLPNPHALRTRALGSVT